MLSPFCPSSLINERQGRTIAVHKPVCRSELDDGDLEEFRAGNDAQPGVVPEREEHVGGADGGVVALVQHPRHDLRLVYRHGCTSYPPNQVWVSDLFTEHRTDGRIRRVLGHRDLGGV